MKFIDLVKNSINTICAKYLNEKEEIEYLPIFYIAGSQTLPPPLPPEEEAEFMGALVKFIPNADTEKLIQVMSMMLKLFDVESAWTWKGTR